jgi:hypothetical protein
VIFGKEVFMWTRVCKWEVFKCILYRRIGIIGGGFIAVEGFEYVIWGELVVKWSGDLRFVL